MSGSGLFSNQAPVKAHLVRGTGGIAGEISDLRDDVRNVLAPVAALTVEEFTNVAAADADGIKLSFASVATATSYTGAALDGVVGVAAMSPPRNITVTTAGVTPADAPATLTVVGVDINGDAISEAIAIPQTATIAVGAKAFAKVTSLALTAGDGTGALLTVGFGALIGLGEKLVTRAGFSGPVREIAAGSVVTNGVFASAAVGAPNGTYAPNSAPNGTNDYCLYYEYDPLA